MKQTIADKKQLDCLQEILEKLALLEKQQGQLTDELKDTKNMVMSIRRQVSSISASLITAQPVDGFAELIGKALKETGGEK